MGMPGLQQVIRDLQKHVAPEGRDGLSDAELLERFAGHRDEAAFEVLLWRHGPLVLSTCRRLLSREQDAEDAFQATFLVLVRKAGTVSKRQSLASWLYKVACRTALAVRARARTRGEILTPSIDTPAPEAADELLWRDLRPVLDEEIARLPEKYRAPFVLCYLQGNTNEEAAQSLGWARGTVASRLAWARRRLRKRLTRRGLAPAALALAALPRQAGTLPPSLVTASLRSATSFASGHGCASGPGMLARSILRDLAISRLCVLLVPVLVVVLMAGGALFATLSTAGHPSRKTPPHTVRGLTLAQAKTEPPRELVRLGDTRLHHTANVTAVAFTPDGSSLVSSSRDGSVRVWDASTGEEKMVLAHPGPVLSLAIDPNGKDVTTVGSDGRLRVWDLKTGKETFRDRDRDRVATGAVTYAPNGQAFAIAARDRGAQVRIQVYIKGRKGLHPVQGQRHELTETFTDNPRALTFSPDGKFLAAAGQNQVHVWNTDRYLKKARIQITRGLQHLCFSPDGKKLAIVESEIVRLWLPASGVGVSRIKSSAELRRAAFSPDSKTIALATADGRVRLVNENSGERLWEVRVHPSEPVVSLCFSPDGKTLATAGGDHGIRLWNTATGKERLPMPGHRSTVTALSFAPDGRTLISGDRDGRVMQWDLATDKPSDQFGNLPAPVVSLSFHPDGSRIALASSKVEIRDVKTGTNRLVIASPYTGQYSFCSASYTPEGRSLLTLGNDGAVRLWDAGTGKQKALLGRAASFGPALALAPDGSTVATGLHELRQSPNGGICFWDIGGGYAWVISPMRVFQVDFAGLPSLAFSPDGRTLASGDGDITQRAPTPGTIRLWEVATGKERLHWRSDKWLEGPLAFSPDGRTLAVPRQDGPVVLFDVSTGKEVHRLTGHRGKVTVLAFSSDGRFLATGSTDCTVLVRRLPGQQSAPSPVPTAAQLRALWQDLAGRDAERAYRAVWALVASPKQSVPFIQKHLRPATRADVERIERLAARMNDKTYAVRRKAVAELKALGIMAEPVLRRVLSRMDSPASRRRVEALLALLPQQPIPPEWLQTVRALEVLEKVGTAEAQTLLRSLASGASGALLTEEAWRCLAHKERTKGS
jgi:RNA polymerase sigma factor (sigma-70 family)